jgi:hypothetical protein
LIRHLTLKYISPETGLCPCVRMRGCAIKIENYRIDLDQILHSMLGVTSLGTSARYLILNNVELWAHSILGSSISHLTFVSE